jgi:hypothetical protein
MRTLLYSRQLIITGGDPCNSNCGDGIREDRGSNGGLGGHGSNAGSVGEGGHNGKNASRC